MVGMKFKIGAEPAGRRRAWRARAMPAMISYSWSTPTRATPWQAIRFLAGSAPRDRHPLVRGADRWHADFRGLRDVRLRGNVDVCAGQSEISRVGMREMMAAGAIDVCNYDASGSAGRPSGGASPRSRRVRRPARPPRGGPGRVAPARLAAACDLCRGVPAGPRPDLVELVENRPALVDGMLEPRYSRTRSSRCRLHRGPQSQWPLLPDQGLSARSGEFRGQAPALIAQLRRSPGAALVRGSRRASSGSGQLDRPVADLDRIGALARVGEGLRSELLGDLDLGRHDRRCTVRGASSNSSGLSPTRTPRRPRVELPGWSSSASSIA